MNLANGTATPTVLIVDDDADGRESLAVIFQSQGFEPWEAGTASEALRRAAGRPDLIVLDVHLPDGDGVDVCRRLKAAPATAGTPVLMLSGRSVWAGDQVKGLEHGADVYLTKPADPAVLVAHARGLVRAHRAEDRLRASEARFRAVVEKAFDAVHLVDAAGTILYSSPTKDRALGYQPDEVVGRSGFEFVHPDDVARVRTEFAAALAAREVTARIAYRGRRRDGSVRALESRVTNLLHDPAVRAVVVNLRDVTDRVAAEAARDRLAAVVASSDDAVVAVTPDGVVTDWNAAAERLYGYAAAEVVGRRARQVIPPDRAAEVAAVLARAASGERVEPHDSVRVRKDGARIDVSVSASPIRDAAGRVVGVARITRDVTARRRAEADLRDARAAAERGLAQLRTIVSSIADGVIVADTAGRVVDWNPAALRIHGYADAAAAPGHVSELAARFTLAVPGGPPVPDEDRPLARVLRGETLSGYELHVRRVADGSDLVIGYSGAPVRGPGGAIEFGVITLRDVTRRRRAEAEVLTARADAERGLARLQAVVSSMVDGVIVANHDWSVVDWNPAALRMHGFADVGEVRRPVSEHAADLTLTPTGGPTLSVEDWPLRRVLRGETLTDYELTFRRPGTGLERVVSVSGAPVRGPDGRIELGVLTLHDVTDQRRAEEGQRRTAALLQAVVDGTTDLVYAKDLAGRYLMVNEAAARFVGRPAAEMLGRDDTAFFDPASAQVIMGHARAVMASGRSETTELPLTMGGRTRTVLRTAAPLRDGAGAVVGMVGIAHDITDRLRAEADVRRRDRAMQAVTQGILIVDTLSPDHPIVYANPGFGRLTGYDPAEVVGWNCRVLQGPGTDPAAVARLRAAIRAGEAFTGELLNYRKDGTAFWNQLSVSPVRDAEGRLVQYVGVQTDVTARRELAAERDVALARLHLHIERMPLAYVLLDAELRVVEWNPAAERTFGWTRAEALARPPISDWLIAPDAELHAVALLERIRAGDMTAHSVNDNLTKDGRTVTCEWFNTPLLADDGRFTGVLALGRDVTDRKALEEQFRQAQKMEAVGQLAGGIAHDFNNLLTVINGYADLILQGLPADDPNHGLMTEVQKAGDRAAGLTRQLLAFSRRQVVAPRVLDLNAVVVNIANMLRRVLGEDVRLATAPAAGLWPVVADPGQVEQVLLNLAVNARDAMPRGGRLTIATRNEEVTRPAGRMGPDAAPGAYAVLSVADTGAGIPADVLARVFEPFFTTKPAGRGTGLGLATVHGIARQAGGFVTVDTAPGAGTTFAVYLPRAAGPGPGGDAAGPAGGPPPRGTETVLLTEDEDGVRSLARAVLRDAGYTVLEAADGPGAAAAEAGHPGTVDLLITDVVMPGPGGRAVAEHLTDRRPGLRVLFVSGYTDDAIVRHGVFHDRVHFLQKPYTPAALLRKVREILDAPVDDPPRDGDG